MPDLGERPSQFARDPLIALLLLPLAATLASAGDRTVPPVVELARAAPPEFFADAVVRLIRSGQIPQRDIQIDLLEEAFAVAADARESVRLVGLPDLPPDTREIYRHKAGSLGLDALSLRSRILREMVTLDRAKARAMFESIARPRLEPRPCSDPFIADVAAYYDAAAVIAQSAYSDREKSSEQHVQFLTALIAGAQSPNEIAAYVRSLQSIALTGSELSLLAGAIAAKLESIAPDYRPFALSLDALQSEIADFHIGGAFRTYVVNQLKAARCAPDLALGLDQPFFEDDVKPSKRMDSYAIAQTYFDTDIGRQIGGGLFAYRAAEADRKNLLAGLLRDFASWKPPGASVDVLHQRATVLRAMIEFTPRGEDRDRLLKLAAEFLQSSPAERDAPAEWLLEARMLCEQSGPDAPKLIAAYQASGSVSLSLYASLGYFGDSSGISK